MLIIFIATFAILMIICFVKSDDSYGNGWVVGAAVCTVAEIVLVTALILCCVGAAKGKVIDAKIEMYAEENIKIETQISAVVKEYITYEGETFKSIAESDDESIITLVTLFPELQSNTLVSKQMEIYVENNNAIKSLKLSEINVGLYKWWVYFGG
jgi:hypothetical protein